MEKPTVDEAPSSIASIGRYVLTPDIFAILRQQTLDLEGEIQLTAAINIQAASDAVEMIELSGYRFDCGSVQGYIDAIIHSVQYQKI